MESRQPPPTANVSGENNAPSYSIPSESELVLLSLDYLRDLRRNYANKDDLLHAEGLNADWLTVAIFALNRAFDKESLMVNNDAWKSESSALPTRIGIDNLPSLEQMTNEVVYSKNPNSMSNPAGKNGAKNADDPKDEDLEAFTWYDYDDTHASNKHRFYNLNGLGGGSRGPLMLGELAAAGLYQLQARSRLEAEKEMIASPLFDQFLQAVEAKGFFRDTANEKPLKDSRLDEERKERKEAIYEAKYDKVVSKFRAKLALKADPQGDNASRTQEDEITLADFQYTRRLRHCLAARNKRSDGKAPQNFKTSSRVTPGQDNSKDLQEAERLKNVGNAQMQQKNYPAAAEAYTQALKVSPSGPNSHVYFSNRAAAFLSMKRFPEAISDSERSLALKPNYGKAHARLGLGHFLLGDYKQAMEAYTVALKYEPDNKSSRSYLEKAKKRLAKHEDQSAVPGSSFSVVSEWDKNQQLDNRQNQEREAEKAKVQGNQFMAKRKYQEAYEAYTKAISLSPAGPQSHVYFSNRAASLCYLEKYEDAASDSQQSLSLKPDYGKAHARLGLSRFFLNDYLGAIQAYTAALEYDPDNAASKSYLAKAKLKWDQQGEPSPKQPIPKHEVDEESRRLINDPDMQLMAKKAMATSPRSGAHLLQDPEMQRIAKKAIHDPTMLSAVKAVVNN